MSTKSRPRREPQPPPPDLVAEFGGRLLAAADALEAESIAAAVLTVPYRDDVGPLGAVFLRALIERAGNDPSPGSAALLRALVALAPPSERRLAVAALGEVTDAGHYPPEWAAQIGRAAPGEAWRRFDVYGDTETIVVTYRYGEAEHAILVQVDRCREPTVLAARLASDAASIRSVLETDDDPLYRMEPIGLAEARRRLADPLGRDQAHDLLGPEGAEPLAGLAIARARLRRLPAGDDRPAPAAYGAADRAAAAAEFLASGQAPDAGDEKVARFWAEVLTGYSAYLPGDPPARVGPLKLSQMLLAYVPNTFALTEEQRSGLPGAVTAWTRWAAQRQGLAEAAVADLDQRLPEILATFDAAYQDPGAVGIRAYLADLSTTTTDAAVLTEALNRRALAVPLPDQRDGDLRRRNAADPAARRALVEQEYGECKPPEGMSRADFLAAAVRVCEQLWHDDPPERWRVAQRLSAAGTSDHDIVHKLVAQAG